MTEMRAYTGIALLPRMCIGNGKDNDGLFILYFRICLYWSGFSYVESGTFACVLFWWTGHNRAYGIVVCVLNMQTYLSSNLNRSNSKCFHLHLHLWDIFYMLILQFFKLWFTFITLYKPNFMPLLLASWVVTRKLCI